MAKYTKIDCAIILIDISGFTQLVYQANYKEEIMKVVIDAMQIMFEDSIEFDAKNEDIQIINTTGDGFYAIATGIKSCETAINFANLIRDQFNKEVKPIIYSVPFRQTVDLRIALHYGSVYKIEIPRINLDNYPVYIGDDLNFTSRVVNSHTARRYIYAQSRSFIKKLNPDDILEPDEVILNKNSYPEKIEIYRLR